MSHWSRKHRLTGSSASNCCGLSYGLFLWSQRKNAPAHKWRAAISNFLCRAFAEHRTGFSIHCHHADLVAPKASDMAQDRVAASAF